MESTILNPQKLNTNNSLPKTMQAAVLVKPGRFEWQEVSTPEPKPGEVLVRLEGCGLCASNIPMWEGREWFDYPVAAGNPGHEGYGTVVKTGENVTQVAEGDRVSLLSFNAFAEYDKAPEQSVVKIPDSLQNVPFPGEPLGCAMNIFGRSDIEKGHKVAIVGAGFLGLLLIQLAKNAGAEVMAISRREFSLQAAEELGAKTFAIDDHQKVIEAVKSWTDNNFCDRVIEATGKESALNLAAELTAVRGKLIVAGFHQDGFRNVNMQLWNWRGIDVINAHERDPQEYMRGMHAAVEAVRSGQINPEALFTHHYSRNEINEAFADLTSRPKGFIKGIIKL